MVKIMFQCNKWLQRSTQKFCVDKQTNKQTNRYTDSNAIPSPLTRVKNRTTGPVAYLGPGQMLVFGSKSKPTFGSILTGGSGEEDF